MYVYLGDVGVDHLRPTHCRARSPGDWLESLERVGGDRAAADGVDSSADRSAYEGHELAEVDHALLARLGDEAVADLLVDLDEGAAGDALSAWPA